MKKLVLLTMIVCMAIPCFGDATRWNIRKRPTADWLTGATGNKDTAWAWMKAIDLLVGGSNVNQGTVYYVDNNSGLDTHDGLSWNNAVLTITKAMVLSHLNIATSPNYANRNTIYVRGDDFDEDWTDLAQKTDIIGVGSDDGNKGPRILGNHVIDATATDYIYMGCRFINMTFLNQTATDIFEVPTGHHGLEWIGCTFESNSSTLAPSAIDITECSDTRIVGCDFVSSVNPMWASGAIDFGANLCQGTEILNNYIDAAIGITIAGGASGLSSRIEGNTIYASTLTIDDNSDVFYIANNTLVSDATFGTSSYDFNELLAVGNLLTGSNYTQNIPIIGVRYFTVTADFESGTWNTQTAHEIAEVTGSVRMQIMIQITEDVVTASNDGTLSLGFAGNPADIIAVTDIDGGTGDLNVGIVTAVYGGSITSVIGGTEAQSALIHSIFDVVVVGGVDVGYTIATNNASDGILIFHIWWEPITPDGLVTAGNGGDFS